MPLIMIMMLMKMMLMIMIMMLYVYHEKYNTCRFFVNISFYSKYSPAAPCVNDIANVVAYLIKLSHHFKRPIKCVRIILQPVFL